VSQTRAADDFVTIRARMKELAREADAWTAGNAAAGREAHPPRDPEQRQKDRRDGHPPARTLTIFAKPLIGRR
jgi:hypothetical protein